MELPRGAGILLHPTSLPGRYGIGDLGPEAYAFAAFLNDAGQTLWQMLPLGPIGYGDSPYACYSAFAGNTLLISPDQLATEGLLSTDDLSSVSSSPPDIVDYEKAHHLKSDLLDKAYARFKEAPDHPLTDLFETFKQQNATWLDDYALFRVLKTVNNGASWHQWDLPLARREATAVARARSEFSYELAREKFFQFLFFKQWDALKTYCNKHRITLVGDIPIFVAHDSADVWTNPEQFKLSEDGQPLVVAGVPPDYFSATGQFWGNPLYNWDQMLADGFQWWTNRFRASLKMFDLVRVDHFRGFAACWEIPAGDKTAERGKWVEAPGRELFKSVQDALGYLPVIAEDLGVITPDVEQLRDDFGFPGMRVLQFAFSGDSSNHDLPHNYIRNVVAYTGTHDNNTTVGWFNSVAGKESTRTAEEVESEREFCKKYLNTNADEVHWDFIRAAYSSVGNTAIVPLQDVLGLGAEARMNLPNSSERNWRWRFKSGALTPKIALRLKGLAELYGRTEAR
jgi:4-alpha-glucanotransferase